MDIDKNSKEYIEAKWFITRLFGFDTMSKKEIIKVCEIAVAVAKKEIPDD